jgi:hypothetical protein
MRIGNSLKASSVILILYGGSVIGAEQHNYKTMRVLAEQFSIPTKPPK